MGKLIVFDPAKGAAVCRLEDEDFLGAEHIVSRACALVDEKGGGHQITVGSKYAEFRPARWSPQRTQAFVGIMISLACDRGWEIEDRRQPIDEEREFIDAVAAFGPELDGCEVMEQVSAYRMEAERVGTCPWRLLACEMLGIVHDFGAHDSGEFVPPLPKEPNTDQRADAKVIPFPKVVR